MEVFVEIKGIRGRYEVSNMGNVRSLNRSKPILMKQYVDFQGYKTIFFHKGDGDYKVHKVHRLVAIAFIPNPENKCCVNHKNGVKTDNREENLEWCTHSENQIHKFKVLGHKIHWTGKFGVSNSKSKAVIQCTMDGDVVAEYGGVHEAARITGFNRGAIGNCCRGIANHHKGFKWKFK